MSEQKWEYCQLILANWQQKGKDWYYDLSIFFCGGGVSIYEELATINGKNAKPIKYNVWPVALGLLGENGWEMVSAQHANFTNYSPGGLLVSGQAVAYLLSSNGIAYFKRPVQVGRKVNEPKFVFPT